jgi:hypothetical protein
MKTKLKAVSRNVSPAASTLVNDVLMQIAKQVEGNYQGADYFSLP